MKNIMPGIKKWLDTKEKIDELEDTAIETI